MQIDIATHIEKLLFLHDALTIPGFGAFSARPAAASADYVGGSVMPPSKTLTFNENITTDDGLLVQDVAKAYGMSIEGARNSVSEFVDNMQDLLNRREIVTLRGVGRLYKNYVQKIQFLPDTTNFNPESYGLPPLQFHPIARSREVVAETPPAPAQESPAVQAAPQQAPPQAPPAPEQSAAAAPNVPPPFVAPQQVEVEKSGSGLVPMLIVMLVLLCGAAGYWAWKQTKSKDGDKPASEQPIAKTETKDKTTDAPIEKSEPEPKTEDIKPKPTATPEPEPEKTPAQAAAEKMQEARKSVQEGKGARECILIIATLQEKANVDRLRNMLNKAGYSVYEVRKGGYQVGVKFRYNNIREVQEKMVALSKLTGEKQIWIKKK